MPSVGGRSRIAMAGFGVPLHARHCLVAELVPNDFSSGLVQREQPPLMRLLVIGGRDVAVKSHFEIRLSRPRRGRHVNTIVPGDRRRVRESRDWGPPTNLLTFLNIPPRWNRCVRLQ